MKQMMTKILLISLMSLTAFAQLSPVAGLIEKYNDAYIWQLTEDVDFQTLFAELNLRQFQVATDVSSPAVLIAGRFVVASGCMKHACPISNGAVILDRQTQGVLIIQKEYNLMTDDFNAITVRSNPAWDESFGTSLPQLKVKLPLVLKQEIRRSLGFAIL